jgi:hypothetical protein
MSYLHRRVVVVPEHLEQVIVARHFWIEVHLDGLGEVALK